VGAYRHRFLSLIVISLLQNKVNYSCVLCVCVCVCISVVLTALCYRFGSFLGHTVMRLITTFRSTTERIYDRGPIRLYYNIVL